MTPFEAAFTILLHHCELKQVRAPTRPYWAEQLFKVLEGSQNTS